MVSEAQRREKAFEQEVTRVARWLYPDTDGDGAIMFNGQERDGVFVNDDVAVAIESTVSQTRGKALSDARKLDELCLHLQDKYPGREVRGYLVTKTEPTAEQRTAVQSVGNQLVSIISFEVFRNRLLNVSDYLSHRRESSFGSARDLVNGSYKDIGEYFPMDFVDVRDNAQTVSYRRVVAQVRATQRVVISGDYGAGKSMTLRQAFFDLADKYGIDGETHFPIHISLRDHHGQTDPVEALERHARSIGFRRADHLVRAWRAGYAHILLDGFDEIAPANIGGGYFENERSARYSSVELVRRFVRDTPNTVGVLIAGRKNLFYKASDLEEALGLNEAAVMLSATDFTDQQVSDYLSRQGWVADIPAWLPPRPLLLGYLATQNILEEFVRKDTLDAPEGWDLLLARTFERESNIEGGVSGDQLRSVFERLATKARATGSGVGPVFLEDIRQSFREVVGYPPDIRQDVLLRRLPWLAIEDPKTESRKIMDSVLADVARAGDVVKYVYDPYSTNLPSEDWLQLLEEVGISSAAHRLGVEEAGAGLVSTALRYAVNGHGVAPPLAADLLAIALELKSNIAGPIYLRGLTVADFVVPAGVDLASVQFQDCFFGRLEIGSDHQAIPQFYGCAFLQVEGVRQQEDLPPDKFVNCEFDDFLISSATTDSLLELPYSPSVLAGLVILKKLYVQAGAGRKDSALRRGMPPQYYQVVNSVMGVLVATGLVVSTRRNTSKIWVPIRSQSARVANILDAAITGDWPRDEDLIERLAALD
ncbi:NACHT domain-containing protein [Saccharothrix carnea]|uniref:NACHT domain-containing protein n=1 Tax=Saccharothrix carnea TaxID=1280637 RepID=UPI000A7BDFD1